VLRKTHMAYPTVINPPVFLDSGIAAKIGLRHPCHGVSREQLRVGGLAVTSSSESEQRGCWSLTVHLFSAELDVEELSGHLHQRRAKPASQ
jgi:hypothetical protein